MSEEIAGREKKVNQLLSFGADVAGQSTELAKLVAERLACVTPPEPPEVPKDTKVEASRRVYDTRRTRPAERIAAGD